MNIWMELDFSHYFAEFVVKSTLITAEKMLQHENEWNIFLREKMSQLTHSMLIKYPFDNYL